MEETVVAPATPSGRGEYLLFEYLGPRPILLERVCVVSFLSLGALNPVLF